MREGFLVRLAIAVVLLLGALVASDGGLAHALAHLREARHEAAHDADHGEHHRDADDHTAVVDAPEQHDGHQHARIDDGIRARVDSFAILRPVSASLPVARELQTSTAAVAAHAMLPRADPATGPPPRLRAPPAA